MYDWDYSTIFVFPLFTTSHSNSTFFYSIWFLNVKFISGRNLWKTVKNWQKTPKMWIMAELLHLVELLVCYCSLPRKRCIQITVMLMLLTRHLFSYWFIFQKQIKYFFRENEEWNCIFKFFSFEVSYWDRNPLEVISNLSFHVWFLDQRSNEHRSN